MCWKPTSILISVLGRYLLRWLIYLNDFLENLLSDSSSVLALWVVTARFSSCGKVMFSQDRSHTQHPLHISHSWTYPPPHVSDIWWSSLEACSNLFTWGPNPTVLTSSGGHQSGQVCILLERCLVINASWFKASQLTHHLTLYSPKPQQSVETTEAFH